MIYPHPHPSKWQKYQRNLKKAARRQRLLKKLPKLAAVAAGAGAVLMLVFFVGTRISDRLARPHPEPPIPAKKQEALPQASAGRNLAEYLNDTVNDSSGLADQFVLFKGGNRFFVRTTINTKLQKFIVRTVERSGTLQSAVVVLNPDDGQVLSMVNYDANGNGINLCLQAEFPAASLFKIVSASAALESAGFTLDKKLVYHGSKHTLYKYQLKTKKGRYTSETIFRKAFASSNNPVFGQIGIYDLGQDLLVKYSDKFFFNQRIAFDLPVGVSRVDVPADDFGLAEIASGFNKRTLISPLHATLLAAVAVNNGEMPTPWLVETIRNESNRVIYQAGRPVLNASLSRKTAADLKALMQDAVSYGTVRSAFRKLRRKKMFAHFFLGAKTGTINDRMDQFKYDWLTAFAVAPDGTGSICIGVLGIHGKVLGTRSTEMARAIIDYYFSSVDMQKKK